MRICPYCNAKYSLGTIETSALKYAPNMTSIAATSCCKRPVSIKCIRTLSVQKVYTEQKVDDWGVPFKEPLPPLTFKNGDTIFISIGGDPAVRCEVTSFDHEIDRGIDYYSFGVRGYYDSSLSFYMWFTRKGTDRLVDTASDAYEIIL